MTSMKESAVTTYITDFLGPTEEPDDLKVHEDTQHSLIHGERSGLAGHQHLIHVAHIIFRYQFLDIVADVVGAPRHPNLIPVPRTFSPNFKEVVRLTKVFLTMCYTLRF